MTRVNSVRGIKRNMKREKNLRLMTKQHRFDFLFCVFFIFSVTAASLLFISFLYTERV